MRNRISGILNITGCLLMTLVILAALLLYVSGLFGIQVYEICSGSMEPSYKKGGIVFVRECSPKEIGVGDIITFRLDTEPEVCMTHRVIEINENGSFVTKGDANNTDDPIPVAEERVIGQVCFYLPFLVSSYGGFILLPVFGMAVICWLTAYKVKGMENDRGRVGGGFLRVFGICLILGGIGYLLSVSAGYREAESAYTGLAEKVFNGENCDEEQEESRADEENADKTICDAVGRLMEENSDIIGFLVFENEGVAYPVMQGDDNSYYLEYMWSGEKNSAGSIFADALNHRDWQDSHTILYGHNMRNGSMFGFLKKYRDEEYYPGHDTFIVYTAEKVYCYQIFSCREVPEDSEIYTIWYTPDDAFESRVSEMKQNSYYNMGVEATGEDKILTLSTCSASGIRFLVHAKRLDGRQ